jgi:putative heme iron utilization protein
MAVFSEDVVAAVKRHMNVDHAEDSLLICRSLGGQPQATAAAMTGMDEHGIDFIASIGEREMTLRLPWSETLSERAQVRIEVVRMYREACEALGMEPRAAE